MKKVLFTLAAMVLASGTMFAQEDKAAAKAAAAAEKQAIKDAENMLKNGLKIYDEAKLKFDDMNGPTFAQFEKDPEKKKAMKEAAQVEILELSKKADPIVAQALATGKIPEKKLFDVWQKRDFMISQMINAELAKASQNIPFDTVHFVKLANDMSDACHYQLKYGNPKDETQKTVMVMVGEKFPRIHTYHAYSTMFMIQRNDLKGAVEAFNNYKNFGKKYPEVASSAAVKNPETPYSQLAFNIYYTAYNEKDYATMSQFYDEALTYEDESSRNFVTQSGIQVYLQKGDTAGWVNACKEAIKKDPTSESAETYAQNLLAYFSKKGPQAMGQFADEMLAISPESKIANYGKGYTYFLEQKYEEALKYYQKTVELDPDYMEGNFQSGFCLYQIGLNNYRSIQNKKYSTQVAADKDSETKVKQYFRQAVPYFEKVRELTPDDPSKWAGELKVIYTNLGQKAKAAELPADY